MKNLNLLFYMIKMGEHTIREILQQPEMWKKELEIIDQNKEIIKDFFESKIISEDIEIILTGAGTSAFIGNALAFLLQEKGYLNVKAAPTTDILTHPKSFFSKEKNVVLVSFARSGNSPESIVAVEYANRYSKNAQHIIITCNKDGELAKNIDKENSLLLLLPPETNDVSLAMTSSFTTMIVAFLLMLNIDKIESQKELINRISESSERFVTMYQSEIEKIASREFKRAVFLGSGELKGVAEECHLKLQEMTDGKVVCKHDSFLGFRHGPKAVIDKDTLLVYLLSSDEFVRKYEIDLIKQINQNNNVVGQIIVSTGQKPNIEIEGIDLYIHFDNMQQADNVFIFIPYVLVGQLLGYYKSFDLGLNPDAPSVSGNIARVVEGVTIYSK
jgi:tagatose-6-phosphate ketose/aldose isomerase